MKTSMSDRPAYPDFSRRPVREARSAEGAGLKVRASLRAGTEGVPELTEEHWKLVNYLRD